MFKKIYFFLIINFIFSISSYALDNNTHNTLPPVPEVNPDNPGAVVMTIIRYLLNDFTLTSMFYSVMCYLCLFITAALGIKQLFIRTDDQDQGGFWKTIKVAGWAIAGLLGIIIRKSIGGNQ